MQAVLEQNHIAERVLGRTDGPFGKKNRISRSADAGESEPWHALRSLLVDDTGKLRITDFGVARIEQDAGMTMTGDLLGTLRYMSPEQTLAKRMVVDHRTTNGRSKQPGEWAPWSVAHPRRCPPPEARCTRW